MMPNASQQDSTLTPPPGNLALPWKLLISLALVLHLGAVFAIAMAYDPATPLAKDISMAVHPYAELMYLDHGYRFFAPTPSAGHLVRYQLQMPDGTTSTGVFPNLKTQWPRLYYHRFFMLSEKLNRFWDPEEPTADDPPEEKRFWQESRQMFLDVAHGYAMQLLRTTGAKQVTLELVQHDLPSPDDLNRGRPLTDAGLYKTLWTKTYEAPQS
jgi:hypothetical protein